MARLLTARRTALAGLIGVTLATGVAVAAPGGLPGKPAKDPAKSNVRAGVGVVDATWNVGAGGGQYAAKSAGLAAGLTGRDIDSDEMEIKETDGSIDPQSHSVTQADSYGVASRLTARAIVVEGSNDQRVALLKTDNYLAQDILLRRVGQLLEGGDSGITYDAILHSATHNHSSPYYSTTSPGVFVFQDAFDQRMFEYQARAVAKAIELAADDLRPARMAATTVKHTIYKGNIAGIDLGDDGTPAGYPADFGDTGLVVMRFDDVSGKSPKPLAAWMNWGQHPESLDNYDLITADFLGPLERFVERDLGAPLVFSQSDVGSAEGPYFRDGYERLPDGTVRAWAHVGHAQTERGARLLADSVIEAWNLAGTDAAQVPFSSDFPVNAVSEWVPGPVSHPYPSVTNCRTETTFKGQPGAIGVPTCERAPFPEQDNPIVNNLKAHGLPVPEHFSVPGYPAVEENTRLRLQLFRIGEVVLGSCACEAQVDLILNFESRANQVKGDIWDGYDWPCTDNRNGTWSCPTPADRGDRNRDGTKDGIAVISDELFRRMRAQVHNDAVGWDALSYAPYAEAEPADPTQIKGNFTQEELSEKTGFLLPVGLGHSGDYNGYTVSYREYMSRDTYRKALTSYGPHTADYMVTRLVRMAGSLKGGPALAPEVNEAQAVADEVRQEGFARALGAESAKAYDAWRAALPGDAGPVAITAQPKSIQRFDAATVTWRGGSNAVDNPDVRVERRVGKKWVPYADMTGEVQTTVQFPKGAQGLATTYAGMQEWLWTASFEAFDAFPARLGQTPAGQYRFVIDGVSRASLADKPYHLVSDAFTVSPWTGITLGGGAVTPDGDVSFAVAPVAYPRTYRSPFPFIRDDGNKVLCKTCSFRPWASSSAIESATVTVTRADGTVTEVPAQLVDGRWVADTDLAPGDRAVVARGGVVDAFGEINGAPLVLR